MSDLLSTLFGSKARVKLLRFFLFNPTRRFTFDELCEKARLVRRTARTEINTFKKLGIISEEMIDLASKEDKKKNEVLHYVLDSRFSEFQALQTFLFDTASLDGKTLLKCLKKAGTLDFVVISGVFMRDFEHRLDVLITMKKPSIPKIETAIKAFESEVGIGLRFAVITSDDLAFRLDMNDKLVRDIFDYKHEVLIDKLNFGDNFTSNF